MEPDPLPEIRRWLAGALNAARDIVAQESTCAFRHK
jgi:hypothetical protein